MTCTFVQQLLHDKLVTVKGMAGIETGTCSSTGVHDASWVLSFWG